MKIIQRVLVSLSLLFTIGLVASPSFALAATAKDSACSAITGSAACTDTSGSISINGLVKTSIQVLSVVVGLVAVIMVIISGFKYVTSAGDSTKLTSAKNTLLYALIGLVIVAMAQIIVQFVLNKVK